MANLKAHLNLHVLRPGAGLSSWLARLAVCLLLVTPVVAQTASWNREQSGTLSWLHAVFFLDQNRGWAAGSRGTLLSTVDGGKSWQSRSASTRDQVRDIFFIDERNGWLVCEVSIYELKTNEQPRAYLMHTIDGGENWTRVEIKGFEVDSTLVRAVFSRNGKGWAFGEAGAIFTTRDAGDTWSRLPSPTRHLLLGGVFIDDDRGWIVGAGATIIQTSDGGDTWYQSRLPQVEKTVRFTSASFIDNRVGWAVGSGGNIYQTNNGGRTWQQQQSGVDVDLFDVKFLDAREGWAVGAEGTIIHTVDGGIRWTSERPVTEHPLERVFFTDKAHGWAVGLGGVVLAYSRS